MTPVSEAYIRMWGLVIAADKKIDLATRACSKNGGYREYYQYITGFVPTLQFLSVGQMNGDKKWELWRLGVTEIWTINI